MRRDTGSLLFYSLKAAAGRNFRLGMKKIVGFVAMEMCVGYLLMPHTF